MVAITLPDGSQRQFDGPVSGAVLAASIGPGLAKAALAIKLDGAVKDLQTVIERDAKVEIVTGRSPEALELLRHDAAHVMAEAVQELYPGTQVTFGPATETGFYYDFARDAPVHHRRPRENRGAHARDRQARRADRARGARAHRSRRVLQEQGREIQGRVDRRDPAR